MSYDPIPLSLSQVPTSIVARLTHLALYSVELASAAVVALALCADDLHCLDLTRSARLDYAACRELGLLVQRWRAESQPPVRRLVLDEDHVSPSDFTMVVQGACTPGAVPWEAIDSTSFITEGTEGTPRVFLASDSLTAREWATAIDASYERTPLVPVKVTLRLGSGQSRPAPSPPALPPAPPAPPTPPSAAHYSNALRERDRYMIQWFDYTCKGCGAVWRKQSVTISFRQTAVSECLKGKRSCADRPEFARMCAGDSFITTKHMKGNGGSDLTPSSALVLAAQAHGLLVATDPESGSRVFFQAHPTKPPPAKVPAPVTVVPQELWEME